MPSLIRSETVADDCRKRDQTQCNQHDDANRQADVSCDNFIFHYQSPDSQMKFDAGSWCHVFTWIPHPQEDIPALATIKF